MRNIRGTPLPTPHQFVAVTEASEEPWGCFVSYIAPSLDALAAAGCISQAMVEQCRNAKGRPLKDENGDKFCRIRKPTKDQQERVQVIRYVEDMDRARALPGVSEALPAMTHQQARKLALAAIGRTPEALRRPSEVNMQQRERLVGRWQRQVRWCVVGNVILPDWREVKNGFARGMLPERSA